MNAVSLVAYDEHLFRRESGRILAALTRIFGVHNFELAEDVMQDALCRALEVWKFRGVPENPAAWLMTTAKHRALDVIRRERTVRKFASEHAQWLESEWTVVPTLDELLNESAIRDDQLRMMFSCCHPKLTEEAQVALILNILCGFGAREIAAAFLCKEATAEKRISRGKATLASAQSLFNLTASDFTHRLGAVQRALYLLFNEGFHGAGESAVRVELCEEAMRLARLLFEYGPSATATTCALLALMSLHAARLPARVNGAGDLIPLMAQDRSRWDEPLIEEGLDLLNRSATGVEVSEYHLQAAIAAVHASAHRTDEIRWDQIVALYDALLALRCSPVVALQRALAIAELQGPDSGLEALRAIPGRERLSEYPFFFAAIAELQSRCGNHREAIEQYRVAFDLTRNAMERRFIARRIEVAEMALAQR